MYDPTVGRFISEDPEEFGGGDTDLDRYVKNEATDLVDPTGEAARITNWGAKPVPPGSALRGSIFDPDSPEGRDLLNTLCSSPQALAAQRRRILAEIQKDAEDAVQRRADEMQRLLRQLQQLDFQELLRATECPSRFGPYIRVRGGTGTPYRWGLHDPRGEIQTDIGIEIGGGDEGDPFPQRGGKE